MNKFLCNACCAFILKKKNRKRFRKKYFTKSKLEYLEDKLECLESRLKGVEMLCLDDWVRYMPYYFRLQKKLTYNYKPMKPIITDINRRQIVNLVTFSDKRMQKSADRIKQQALDTNFFNKIYITNEDNLEQEFVEKMRDKLIYGSRGFGYWSWKPQIILQVLNEMKDGEILLYLDAGTHISNSPSAIKNLNNYLEELKKSNNGVLLQSVSGTATKSLNEFLEAVKKINNLFCQSTPFSEKSWTKGDLFEYFNCYNDKNITDTEQRIATLLFLIKNDFSVQFIKEWLSVFYERFDLVSDIPSVKDNFPEFIDNRHDQSVLSILSKKHGCSIVEHYDEYSKNAPFLFKRDKDFSTKVK
jgi:hypothetical protein